MKHLIYIIIVMSMPSCMQGIFKSNDYPEIEGEIGKKYHIDSPNTDKDDVNGNAAWDWIKRPFFKKDKWTEPKYDVNDKETSLFLFEKDTITYKGKEPIKVEWDWKALLTDGKDEK
ncbi:MAG: hypothetical protein MRY83_17955 [Flavobacteriales bacterium]|nr:hypothetical protein [Flavobacteriales bacterium]